VLPCEDLPLRRMTTDRIPQRVSRWDCLPKDIEFEMSQVFQRELDLQRRLEVLKAELSERYDYSTFGGFRTVDLYNDRIIDSAALTRFLRHAGHPPTQEEVMAIIRRFDVDGDAAISYEEWADIVRPSEPLSKQINRFQENHVARTYSPPPTYMRSLYDRSYASPSRGYYQYEEERP